MRAGRRCCAGCRATTWIWFYRAPSHNLSHLLVGSEGTLAYSQRLRLKLAPIPKHRVLGVCHFPTFYQAMDASQHIVKLDPDAVELVDRTMIDLARGNPAYRSIVERFLKGEPDAILLVEFAGEQYADQARKLTQLVSMMGDLGLPGSVVEVTDVALQRDIWEVRKAGLNIMMSMKGDGKPVSFIEDCAVPLEHLAEYTDKLTRVFEKHGTKGTWYAHASVGTLHVRPVLNMKTDGAQKMRAIAEEACALVKQYKGAYSGEHGDGLVRSEWIEPILGERLARALAEVKELFDPKRPDEPRARSFTRAGWTIARCSVSNRATQRPSSTPCWTGANGAASIAPRRCATTMVIAENSTREPCVLLFALLAMSSTLPVGAPIPCGSR